MIKALRKWKYREHISIIKTICDKTAANIIHNGKITKISLTPGKRQDVHSHHSYSINCSRS